VGEELSHGQQRNRLGREPEDGLIDSLAIRPQVKYSGGKPSEVYQGKKKKIGGLYWLSIQTGGEMGRKKVKLPWIRMALKDRKEEGKKLPQFFAQGGKPGPGWGNKRGVKKKKGGGLRNGGSAKKEVEGVIQTGLGEGTGKTGGETITSLFEGTKE